MSEVCQFEENLKTLNEIQQLFDTMSGDVTKLKQEKAKLLMDNRTISDANKSLQESVNRLLRTNEEQHKMLNMLDQTTDKIKLLEIELDDLKKENLKLKDSLGNNFQNIKFTDQSIDSKLENYNTLLQKKIADLEKEKQLLLNRTLDPNFYCNESNKQMSTLKTKYNTLLLENKSLKGQLLNFRNLHNQIIPEIRLNYLNNTTDGNHQENVNLLSMVDAFNQTELQPLRVNVIDINDE